MSITKSFIVVEDRLLELFNYLPPLKNSNNIDFNPVFKFGDEIELNTFLKTKRSETLPYPLIWLIYPYTEEHLRNKVKISKLSFILAVETNTVMLNSERIETSYKQFLIPLFINIKQVFKLGNIINIDDIYTIIKFPNYSNGNKNAMTDIWDAIKVTINCTINDNELNEININGNIATPVVNMPSLLTSNLTDLIGTAKV